MIASASLAVWILYGAAGIVGWFILAIIVGLIAAKAAEGN